MIDSAFATARVGLGITPYARPISLSLPPLLRAFGDASAFGASGAARRVGALQLGWGLPRAPVCTRALGVGLA